MSVFRALIELLFVPRCASCDETLPGDAGNVSPGFCDTCAISLYPVFAACPRCALPSDGETAGVCPRCRRFPPPYAAASASFLYGGELACALRRLKFNGREEIARSLGPLIAPGLARAAAGTDRLVPVPLHWRRLSRRGYNQADALLRHGTQGLPIPIDRLSLRRVRATPPQIGLAARARAKNVQRAFAVVPKRRRHVAGRNILLVDDVVTTGATVAAAAAALRDAGAHRVTVYSVARAEPPCRLGAGPSSE